MFLSIDGYRCDPPAQGAALWGYDASELSDPLSRREGRSLQLDLPPTEANRAVFAQAELPGGTAAFNGALHEAVAGAEGVPLLRGTVRLLEASQEGYRIEIRGGAAQWAKRASTGMFDALDVEWEGRLTPQEICDSWRSCNPVVFLPVQRDAYASRPSSTGLEAVQRILSTGDYHPFLHLDTLLRRLFTEAGYTVRSRFMEGAFFRSLYMSGAYAAVDTAAVERRMGFFARRRGEASARAGSDGRVYASPYVTQASVGNFVDAFLPTDTDDEQRPLTDAYSLSGCFGMEQGRILFRPMTAVQVGFEFRLRYVTDYRILSRQRLKGFDAAYLGSGTEVEFALTNRFEDRRGAASGGYLYRAVVFDHAEGRSYRVVERSGAALPRTWGSFASRSAQVAAPEGEVDPDPVLQYLSAGGEWLDYAGDWALYDGYVGETGSIEAEVTLRTPPETVTPAQPRDFRTLYFHGAEPGMELTLKRECTLRPLFSQVPGAGSKLAFADVARHRVRQGELVDAVCHLFNLRLFTDEQAKEVCVEPEADFYDRTRLFDWSDRIDPCVPARLSDRALEEHESRRYCYLAGDGAVARLDAEGGEPFGEWVSATASFAARQGEQTLRNPLFAPTLNVGGFFPGAPSALVPSVGDRDDAAQGESFMPRIVSFCGLRPLPDGEAWGFPAPAGRYPLAGFHLPEEGLTLCFADREGVAGLHTFYDAAEERRSLGQVLRLRLRLTPPEAEALQHRSDGINAGLDSVFVLRVGGVPLRCILRAVEEYDPAAASVGCVFETLVDRQP